MKASTRNYYQGLVGAAAARIANGLDEALDTSALAKTACLAPLHFHHVYRGMVGETPLETHRRMRLERAAHQLANLDEPITMIAFDARYETPEAFSRAFRAAYALAPSDFRKRARAADAASSRPLPTHLAARSGLHFEPNSRAHVDLIIDPGETMNVIIAELSPMRVAAVHHRGPYARISEAFVALDETPGVREMGRLAGAMLIAIYHDDPESKPPEDLESDAGLVIPRDVAMPRGLIELEVAGGCYAKATHVGPYTELGDAWARLLGQWLPTSGARLGEGSSFEIYRNTPMETPAAELRTDLYVPLVSRG